MMRYGTIENLLHGEEYPEDYNFEQEAGIEDYADMSPLDRYCTYRASDKRIAKTNCYPISKAFAEEVQRNYPGLIGFDCDGSGDEAYHQLCMLSRDIYRALWSWEDRHNGKCQTYGICSAEVFGRMGPDTMHSAQTLIDAFLKDIHKKHEDGIFKNKKTGNISIRYMLALYKDKDTCDTFVKEMNAIPHLAKYLDAYHTIGNFTLVPAFFNPYRGISSAVRDYWCKSLELMRNKNSVWIYRDSYGGGHEIQWEKENYHLYSNFFFLWDYTQPNTKLTELSEILENDPGEYMHLMVGMIKRRGIFMVMLLRLMEHIGSDAYATLRKELFCKADAIYSGYDEVCDSITSYLIDESSAGLVKTAKEKIASIKI